MYIGKMHKDARFFHAYCARFYRAYAIYTYKFIERMCILVIIYKIDVLKELKEHGYSTYKIRKDKIFDQTQLQKMRSGEKITFEVLDKVCKLTGLQPGDILEYRENTEVR